MPKEGGFVGLGGGYNSVNLSQNLSAAGVSNVYTGGALVASGQAGGPASPFHDNQNTFAPEVQAGYYDHFGNPNQLFGLKFLYKYLGTTSTDSHVDSFQVGSFTSQTAASFVGNVLINSAQTAINHNMALMAFTGHSFLNSFVYFGAGPTLFKTKSHLYGATGFADINGVHADITGAPTNFSFSKWMWGAAAQIGLAYFFSPSWFLDFSYTYSITGRYTSNVSGPFSSSTTSGGVTYTDTGTLYASTNQRVTSQAFSLSINKSF